MNTTNIVNESLKYIESHLCDPITPEMVAAYTGYSPYHFFRMFSEVVGTSLKQYITGRRIEYVLYDAHKGQLLTDSVFDYQFDTYSGFYKACKKRYGMAPKEMIKLGMMKMPSLYLYGKEQYPMITEAKLKNLLKNWPLEIQHLVPVMSKNGEKRKDLWELNHRYRITMSHELNKINQNIHITQTLRAQNIMTPDFIKTRDGKCFLESGKQYVFIKETPDHQNHSIEDLLSDEDKVYVLGASVSKLHKVLKTLDNQKSDVTHVYKTCKDWALPIVEKFEDRVADPIDQSFYEHYHNEFSQLSQELPLSIIHRNLHLDNVFYNGEELVGYGDFYLTQKDVKIFDLCYLSTSILSGMKEEQRGQWPQLYKTLIKGYESVLPLVASEKESLKYVLYSIQMIFIAYFATQENYEDLALKNYQLLKWLYAQFED